MEKLYSNLSTWWPLLSPPEDYAGEAAFFAQVISDSGLPATPTMLELGCGGGCNALYLKKLFAQVVLTDLSPDMLVMSRALNPECEHLVADMKTLRLGRMFDVVFIHDAIDYMTTPEDLAKAMATAFIHCKPGGLAMFVPDHVRETFEESTDHDGNEGNSRALRYLEWSYDPDPNDTTYTVDYVYVLRDGDQPVHVEHDQHICGLFARAEWARLLQAVGFTFEIVCDDYKRDIFVARRPNE